MIDWDILKETLDETQYKVLELFLVSQIQKKVVELHI